MMDYTPEERGLLRSAGLICFPMRHLVRVLHAAGIPTFPNETTYIHRSSFIHQVLLLKVLSHPIPRTKLYYGCHRGPEILKDFPLPLIIGPPFNQPDARIAVHSLQQLLAHCTRWNPLVVREYIPWEKKLTFICTNYEIIGCLTPNEKGRPPAALPLDQEDCRALAAATRRLIRQAHLDDIQVEWCFGKGTWHVVSLGHPPVQWKSPEGIRMNRFDFIAGQIAQGSL